MDLVWSSHSGANDRQARMWTGNGQGFSVAPMLAPAPTWDIIAGGDLDSNGKSDLILQTSEGSAFWYMNGAQVVAFSPGFLTGRIDTVGDYNGDGRIDLMRFSGQNFCDEASASLYFSNGIGLVPFGGGTSPPPAPPSFAALISTRLLWESSRDSSTGQINWNQLKNRRW